MTSAGTVSAWIYPTSFPNVFNTVVMMNDTSNYFQCFVKSTGKMAWYVSASGPPNIDPGSATLSTNTWYHVVQRFANGAGHATFINGVSDGTSGLSGLSPVTSGSLGIGYDVTGGSLTFAGRIADACVWNSALTNAEVAALAAGMRPYRIQRGNIIAYLPFDGVSSPEPDLSGFANNGTLTGTTNTAGPPLTFFTPRMPIWEIPQLPPTPLMGQIWI